MRLLCFACAATTVSIDHCNQDWRDFLQTITIPVFVTTGKQSKIYPYESSITSAGRFPMRDWSSSKRAAIVLAGIASLNAWDAASRCDRAVSLFQERERSTLSSGYNRDCIVLSGTIDARESPRHQETQLRRNTMMSNTSVFLHGAWMTPLCWEKMLGFFQGKGYICIAPAWPHRDKPIEELRRSRLLRWPGWESPRSSTITSTSSGVSMSRPS
jgi:hypothetical protein